MVVQEGKQNVLRITKGGVEFIDLHPVNSYKTGQTANSYDARAVKSVPVAGPATISLDMPGTMIVAMVSLRIEPNPNINGVGQ